MLHLFFFFQKFQLTNVKDSTNVLFVVIKYGCKVEDLQLKVCIEKIFDQKINFTKKIVFWQDILQYD